MNQYSEPEIDMNIGMTESTTKLIPTEIESVYDASDEVRNLIISIPPHFKLVTKLTQIGSPVSKTVQPFIGAKNYENVSKVPKNRETYPNGAENNNPGTLRSDTEYDTIKLQRMIFAQKAQIDSLQNQLQVLVSKKEGVLEMSVYTQTPFKWLFGMTFSFFTVSLILMLANFSKIGATIGFLSGVLLFISLYALWRFNNIALIRPKSMVLGFVITLGLFLTGITRLI